MLLCQTQVVKLLNLTSNLPLFANLQTCWFVLISILCQISRRLHESWQETIGEKTWSDCKSTSKYTLGQTTWRYRPTFALQSVFSCSTIIHRGFTFGIQLGHIGSTWDKSGTSECSFWLTEKNNFKKSHIYPICAMILLNSLLLIEPKCTESRAKLYCNLIWKTRSYLVHFGSIWPTFSQHLTPLCI